MKFRALPVIIEANQWHGWEHHQPGDLGVDRLPFSLAQFLAVWVSPHDLVEGWIEFPVGQLVSPGDWIITGVKGERYACKPDTFARTYEAVPE